MRQTAQNHTTGPQAAPKEAWDAIAADFDRYVTSRESDLATQALRLAGLKAGHRFLDVAAGSGGLSLPAARLGARIVATDWSPRMIEQFHARAREAGIADAEGYVMDCHALDLADNTFDVTGSQFGVMLVPDQAQALREMVRVTRPGGRVLVIAFNSPERFEQLQFFLAAIRAVMPGFEGLPTDSPPLEFQMADPREMQRRLEAAGLREVSVDTRHEERITVRSGQDVWDWCLGSNPIAGMLVANLTQEQRKAVVEHLQARVADRTRDGGVAVLTAAVNIGVGTK